jgi:hypothetical protein
MNELINNGNFDKSKIFLNFWKGDKCKYGNDFLVKFEIECDVNYKNPIIENFQYFESTDLCGVYVKIKSKYGKKLIKNYIKKKKIILKFFS